MVEPRHISIAKPAMTALSISHLEITEPFDFQQKAKIKNLGSNKFMVISGENITSSTTPDSVFSVSDKFYPGQFFIGNDNCRRFMYCAKSYYTTKFLMWSNGGYAKETTSRWAPKQTPNGWLIHSCFGKELNLVLVQTDDTFACVPWDDIKDTEQEKFAFWEITN